MKYDAALVEKLAAEYVLGTLQGAARRRFDRLITESADIRFMVWRWERHLNGFAGGLKSHKPSRRVWENIRHRIESPRRTTAHRVSWWRGLGLAVPTAVAVAWFAIAFWPAPTVERIAVFADQNADTLWVIAADLDRGILQTEAVNAPPAANDGSYELWVLPADGPPLSLGLLPLNAGPIETGISAELLAALTNSDGLAITVEPAGGSPTGLPSGPIVYQTSLLTI